MPGKCRAALISQCRAHSIKSLDQAIAWTGEIQTHGSLAARPETCPVARRYPGQLQKEPMGFPSIGLVVPLQRHGVEVVLDVLWLWQGVTILAAVEGGMRLIRGQVYVERGPLARSRSGWP